nr:unnamed protein product [Callosobruchus analis]
MCRIYTCVYICKGKREDIKTILYNNNIDVLAISETWLNEKIETSYVTIDGYTFLRRDRGSRGGGVGLYISNSLKFKKITSSGEIEQLWDVDEKIDYLSNAILSVLDRHAPYKLVRFTKKPAPWLTDNLRFIMHLRDVAKAKFNQDKSVESWEKYKKAKNFATQAMKRWKDRHTEGWRDGKVERQKDRKSERQKWGWKGGNAERRKDGTTERR